MIAVMIWQAVYIRTMKGEIKTIQAQNDAFLKVAETQNIAISILNARCEVLEKNRFFQMP